MRREYSSKDEKYKQEQLLSMEMHSNTRFLKNITGLFLLGENGLTCKSSLRSLVHKDFSRELWFLKAKSYDELSYICVSSGSRLTNSLSDDTLMFGCAYKDQKTGQNNGVIILEIRKDNVLNTFTFDSWNTGYTIVFDSHMSRLYECGDKDYYLSLREKVLRKTLFTEKIIRYSAWTKNVPFYIVRAVSRRQLLEDYSILLLLPLCIFVVFILQIPFAWKITAIVTAPIIKLAGLMSRVEGGNLEVSMQPKYNDEISVLIRSFNSMVQKVQKLIRDNELESNERHKLELRLMMAQISPHFLYNALDSIAWLCRKNDTEKAEHMTEALSGFFRTGLSRGKEIVTLGVEIQHIRDYLKIQSIRFDDSFQYTIDVDEKLCRYWTVKFVLQPIVENAISHGVLLQEDEKRYIEITAREEDDDIVIDILNTGLGFQPDEAEQMNRILQQGIIPEEKGFGLFNANKRIMDFFGTQYHISLFSVYGDITVFTVTLPKKDDTAEAKE